LIGSVGRQFMPPHLVLADNMQFDFRSRFKGGTLNGSDYAAAAANGARGRRHAAGNADCLPGLLRLARVSRTVNGASVKDEWMLARQRKPGWSPWPRSI
jgi:hypothetical protein